MQGGVRKRGSRWYYYFDAGIVDGKRKKIEKVGGNTKKEALEALRKALNEYNDSYVVTKDIKLIDYLNEWLEGFIKENRKVNTYNRYSELVKNSINDDIKNISLRDLRPIHIEKVFQIEKEKDLSNTTLQHVYGVLNSALNRVIKLQILKDNPCKYVDRPKRVKFKGNALELEDISALFNSLDLNKYNDYIMYLALKLTLELGLRRGELAGIEWNNINYNEKILSIKNNLIYTNNDVKLDTPKTAESERDIYLSDDLITLLKSHKAIQNKNKLKAGVYYINNSFNSRSCDFIFTWEDGKYVHPNYYTVKFKKTLKKTNIDKKVRFHDLRHTNATLLLSQGIDFKVIQTRLGHSDISTTLNIYSHVNTEMQKNATDKLNNLFKSIK